MKILEKFIKKREKLSLISDNRVFVRIKSVFYIKIKKNIRKKIIEWKFIWGFP